MRILSAFQAFQNLSGSHCSERTLYSGTIALSIIHGFLAAKYKNPHACSPALSCRCVHTPYSVSSAPVRMLVLETNAATTRPSNTYDSTEHGVSSGRNPRPSLLPHPLTNTGIKTAVHKSKHVELCSATLPEPGKGCWLMETWTDGTLRLNATSNPHYCMISPGKRQTRCIAICQTILLCNMRHYSVDHAYHTIPLKQQPST